jgi:hypothetical protein
MSFRAWLDSFALRREWNRAFSEHYFEFLMYCHHWFHILAHDRWDETDDEHELHLQLHAAFGDIRIRTIATFYA